MTADNVIMVSGTIVLLLQVLKGAGLTGRWALIVAALASMAGVALWSYSSAAYSRTALWSLVSGWVAVFTSSAGVFGIVNGGAEAVTTMKGAASALVKSMTGTGDGRTPPAGGQ